jgi:hypothetical protein
LEAWGGGQKPPCVWDCGDGGLFGRESRFQPGCAPEAEQTNGLGGLVECVDDPELRAVAKAHEIGVVGIPGMNKRRPSRRRFADQDADRVVESLELSVGVFGAVGPAVIAELFNVLEKPRASFNAIEDRLRGRRRCLSSLKPAREMLPRFLRVVSGPTAFGDLPFRFRKRGREFDALLGRQHGNFLHRRDGDESRALPLVIDLGHKRIVAPGPLACERGRIAGVGDASMILMHWRIPPAAGDRQASPPAGTAAQ